MSPHISRGGSLLLLLLLLATATGATAQPPGQLYAQPQQQVSQPVSQPAPPPQPGPQSSQRQCTKAHHKDLVPFDVRDGITFALLFIAIFISSGAGVGGGAQHALISAAALC
jgi:hypothetical protein